LEYVKRNYKIGDTVSILLPVAIVRILPCPRLHLKNTCVKYMNHELARRRRLSTRRRDSKFGDEEVM
jgi:hypothetical protein